MDERERRLDTRINEICVETLELGRREHPLVDDRPRREARDDEIRPRRELGDAADDVELPLERVAVQAVGGADERLAEDRGHLGGHAARVLELDGHVAPAEEPLPLVDNDPLDERLELGTARVVVRKEERADPVPARLRQAVQLGGEERVRDLQEDPGSVARVGVRAGGAAMLEIRERGERADDRCMARPAVETRDEGDTAGVVLVGRVVEADPLGWLVPNGHEDPLGESSSALSASRRRRSGRPTSAVECARRTRKSTCGRSVCAASGFRASPVGGNPSTKFSGFNARSPLPNEKSPQDVQRPTGLVARPAPRRRGSARHQCATRVGRVQEPQI